MAKATVIQPKPVKQPPRKIVLELTEGEADFLLGISLHIGGHPTNSPRKYAVRIGDALYAALGVGADQTDAARLRDKTASPKGTIYFRDYPANFRG